MVYNFMQKLQGKNKRIYEHLRLRQKNIRPYRFCMKCEVFALEGKKIADFLC